MFIVEVVSNYNFSYLAENFEGRRRFFYYYVLPDSCLGCTNISSIMAERINILYRVMCIQVTDKIN